MKLISKTIPAFLALTIATTASGKSVYSEDSLPVFGELSFTGDTLVLPLSNDGMQPMLSVDLGDGEQHNFIVDTGASVNVIDASLAQTP